LLTWFTSHGDRDLRPATADILRAFTRDENYVDVYNAQLTTWCRVTVATPDSADWND